MKQILIVGEENACRSQMAEGWMRYYTKNHAEVTSAGVTPTQLDLFAANAMSQAIVDISKQQSKSLKSVADREFDYIFFVFEPENIGSYTFMGTPKIEIHPFEKPKMGKDKAETEKFYAHSCDEIENVVFDYVHQHIRKMY